MFERQLQSKRGELERTLLSHTEIQNSKNLASFFVIDKGVMSQKHSDSVLNAL